MNKPVQKHDYVPDLAKVMGPAGFIEGLILPWAGLRVLVRRPFAWVRVLIVATLIFLAFCMVSGVVLSAIFLARFGPEVHRVGQELLIAFSMWWFFPIVVLASAASWTPFLANKRIGWGLGLEFLRASTGRIMALGFLGMMMGIAAAVLARFLADYSTIASAVASIVLGLVVRTLISLACMHAWAENAKWHAAGKFAFMRFWPVVPAWLGICVGMLLALGAFATVALGLLSAGHALGLGLEGTKLFALLVLLPFGLVIAGWCMALDGFMALGLYQTARTELKPA